MNNFLFRHSIIKIFYNLYYKKIFTVRYNFKNISWDNKPFFYWNEIDILLITDKYNALKTDE